MNEIITNEKIMAGGRPMKFESLEDLKTKIDAYFESCYEERWFDIDKRDKNGKRTMDAETKKWKTEPKKMKVLVKPPTVSGLAVALKTSRRTLLDYEYEVQDNEESREFSHTIKEAKDMIVEIMESGLLTNQFNTTGVIFSLKNNFDFKDKIEQEVTVNDNTDNDLKGLSTAELLARKKKLQEKNGQKEEKQ